MSQNSHEELNDDYFRPETSLNNKRPLTEEGTRSKPFKPQDFSSNPISYNRNAATASNFKSIPLPKNTPQMLEKIGFLNAKEKKVGYSEQKDKNPEYKPLLIMPNIRNSNNFVGGTNSLYRSLPKNLILDKERLYEENLSLKCLVNSLKQENLQLKTKLSSLDRENFKFEKIIYDIDYINNKMPNKPSSNWTAEPTNPQILFNMKRKLKENQMDINKKDKEIEKMKKAPKLTRILELETELKGFAEETVRLRKMLEVNIQLVFPENQNGDFHLEEKLLMQTSALTTLNKERMELITMIQNLNDQIMRKALKQEELEVQLNLYRNDKQRKKFQIKKLNQNSSAVNPKESNKKIQKTMHDKEEVKNIEEKQQEESLKKELEQKSNDISSLSVKLAQKEKKNNELERKIKEINADFSEKLEIENKEKASLSIKLEKERKEIKLLNQKYHNLLGSKQAEKELFDEEKTDPNPEKSPSSSKGFILTVPPPEKKRLPKVNHYDIEEIGLMLKYNLKLKEILPQQLNYILEETAEKSEYTIAEMIDILEKEPFSIKDKEKCVLMSRYMIEDNNLDYVFYEIGLSAPILRIRSVLKNALGHYTLFTKKEMLTFHSEISALVNRVKPTLEDTLKSIAIKKGGIMNRMTNREDIINCLKFCEINLNSKQMDYFMMKLWEVHGKLDEFSIEKIFTTFDPSHIIKEEKEEVYDEDDFDDVKEKGKEESLGYVVENKKVNIQSNNIKDNKNTSNIKGNTKDNHNSFNFKESSANMKDGSWNNANIKESNSDMKDSSSNIKGNGYNFKESSSNFIGNNSAKLKEINSKENDSNITLYKENKKLTEQNISEEIYKNNKGSLKTKNSDKLIEINPTLKESTPINKSTQSKENPQKKKESLKSEYIEKIKNETPKEEMKTKAEYQYTKEKESPKAKMNEMKKNSFKEKINDIPKKKSNDIDEENMIENYKGNKMDESQIKPNSIKNEEEIMKSHQEDYDKIESSIEEKSKKSQKFAEFESKSKDGEDEDDKEDIYAENYEDFNDKNEEYEKEEEQKNFIRDATYDEMDNKSSSFEEKKNSYEKNLGENKDLDEKNEEELNHSELEENQSNEDSYVENSKEFEEEEKLEENKDDNNDDPAVINKNYTNTSLESLV